MFLVVFWRKPGPGTQYVVEETWGGTGKTEVAVAGIFLHPLRGVNTPYFFYVHPHQFDLVTHPWEVKSWTDAQNMEILHEIWSFGFSGKSFNLLPPDVRF